MERRRVVTVVFCDVTGSTSLGESIDPEALRQLLARYFERMKGIVERHGGIVEKFIGDAVMAVFGVPVTHEDDALRAVRAATEMLAALPELGIGARIGINTGEVVTGTTERLVTGDAVNVAARLEQAASPGEILIGDATRRVLGDAAVVEPVAPLDLKGKERAVVAFGLRSVGEAPARPSEGPFVGRDLELETMRAAWDRAVSAARCELVTVVGEAGIGKSRLTAEAVGPLSARVVRSRCPPYGEGITYWPAVEVLRQIDARPRDDAAVAAIGSLLREHESPTTAEEIAWAFRRTLEAAAADGPLVVILDDLQWAEETFLDLVEHVALLASGASILLVCMARPELLERRPSWPVTIRLEPLPDGDVQRLLPGALPDDLRARILAAAGGNPLYLSEIVAMTGTGGGDLAVPPTLRALLAARLDTLDASEREVLELGSVEGEVFHLGAVRALAGEDTRITPRLASLVRRGMIVPAPAHIDGDDAFRFRHLLIRDAAYGSLPKSGRAELHRRLAGWLEAQSTLELDELVAAHLEHAQRYGVELGRPPEQELAAAVRHRLGDAGLRAHRRGDDVAAIGLLERALASVPSSELDLPLEIALAESLSESGRKEQAIARATALADRARSAGDEVGELSARILRAEFRLMFEPSGDTAELDRILASAMPTVQAAGDDLPLYLVYHALAMVALMRGRMDELASMMELALPHATVIGSPIHLLGWIADARMSGTSSVEELLAWLDRQPARMVASPYLVKARAHAMARLGRFDDARAFLARTRSDLEERGARSKLGILLGIDAAQVELLAGDPAAAARCGELADRLLDELGEHAYRSTVNAFLAQSCYGLGRLDEADAAVDRVLELGASEDATNEILWRQVRAKVLARRGALVDAERLAREAVEVAERTDMIESEADARVDLAEVLVLVGRTDDAADALARAMRLYERKGNLVMTGRTRDRLTELRARG
jgi:class 3 adenylate cyclase/tetratricopeptide (TPR) repeat protein